MKKRTFLKLPKEALYFVILFVMVMAIAGPADAAQYEQPSSVEMLQTLNELTALGPRVQGTNAEIQAASYIKNKFDSYSGTENPLQTSILTYDLDDYADCVTSGGYSYNSARNKYCAIAQIQGESLPLYGYLRGNIEAEFPTGGVVDCGTGSAEDIQNALLSEGLTDLTGKAALIASSHTYGYATAEAAAAVNELVNTYHAQAILTASTNELMKGNYLYYFNVSNCQVPIINFGKADGDALRDAIAAEKNITFSSQRMHTVSCVEAVLPATGGETDSILFVTSHLDSVMGAPGANDNGSGTAAVIELARLYAGMDTGNVEIRFLCFGGEEIGLFGSDLYIRDMSEEDKALTLADLNLDMVATSDTSASTLSLTTMDGMTLSAALMSNGKGAMTMDSDTSDVVVVNSGSSDHVSFYYAGMDSMNLIRTRGTPYALETQYHTPNDTVDINISAERMVESTAMASNAIQTVLDANAAKTVDYHLEANTGEVAVIIDNTEQLIGLSDRLCVELIYPNGNTSEFTLAESTADYEFDVTQNGEYSMKLWLMGTAYSSWVNKTTDDYRINLGEYTFEAFKTPPVITAEKDGVPIEEIKVMRTAGGCTDTAVTGETQVYASTSETVAITIFGTPATMTEVQALIDSMSYEVFDPTTETFIAAPGNFSLTLTAEEGGMMIESPISGIVRMHSALNNEPYELVVIVPGDVNMDGGIDSGDWSEVLNYVNDAPRSDFVEYSYNGIPYWKLMADMDDSTLVSGQILVGANDWLTIMCIANDTFN